MRVRYSSYEGYLPLILGVRVDFLLLIVHGGGDHSETFSGMGGSGGGPHDFNVSFELGWTGLGFGVGHWGFED